MEVIVAKATKDQTEVTPVGLTGLREAFEILERTRIGRGIAEQDVARIPALARGYQVILSALGVQNGDAA
jgi:hypothetical protein